MKKKRFLRNALILTLSSLAGRFLGMGFRVWLSQLLGPEGMGAYQLILSVFLPAVSISTAGVSLTVTRLVTRALGKKQLGAIPSAVARCSLFSLAMSLTAGTALWLGADFLSGKFLGGNSADALGLLAPGLPFMALSSCMRGYFLAVRGALPSAASEFAEQLATISLTVAAFLALSPKTTADACLLAMLGATVGEAVSCGCSFVLYRLHLRRFQKGKTFPCPGDGESHPPHHPAQHPEPCRPERPLRCGKPAHPLGAAAVRCPRPPLLWPNTGSFRGWSCPCCFSPSCFLGAFSSLLIPEMSESLAAGRRRSIASVTERSLGLTLAFSLFIACFFLAFGEELGAPLLQQPGGRRVSPDAGPSGAPALSGHGHRRAFKGIGPANRLPGLQHPGRLPPGGPHGLGAAGVRPAGVFLHSLRLRHPEYFPEPLPAAENRPGCVSPCPGGFSGP